MTEAQGEAFDTMYLTDAQRVAAGQGQTLGTALDLLRAYAYTGTIPKTYDFEKAIANLSPTEQNRAVSAYNRLLGTQFQGYAQAQSSIDGFTFATAPYDSTSPKQGQTPTHGGAALRTGVLVGVGVLVVILLLARGR